MVQQRTPAVPVIVPEDDEMAVEPARLIAKVMQVKNALVAIVAAAGFVIAPELSGEIDVVLQALVTAGLLVYGWYTAYAQGEKTRESVYSPATAAKAVSAANRAGINGKRVGYATGQPANFSVPRQGSTDH